MCGSLCVHTHTYAYSVHRGEKGTTNYLELQLQVIASVQAWLLGAKLRYSGRATSILNHEAIAQAPSSALNIK